MRLAISFNRDPLLTRSRCLTEASFVRLAKQVPKWTDVRYISFNSLGSGCEPYLLPLPILGSMGFWVVSGCVELGIFWRAGVRCFAKSRAYCGAAVLVPLR